MRAQETGVKKNLQKVHTYLCFFFDLVELEFMDLARSWAIRKFVRDRQTLTNLSTSVELDLPAAMPATKITNNTRNECSSDSNYEGDHDSDSDSESDSDSDGKQPLAFKEQASSESDDFLFDD